MAVKSLLNETILTAEESTVAGVSPFEDAQGRVTASYNTVCQLIKDLTYLNANMPAGTNKTNLATVIAALSA
jgi:hypothetical protein